MTHAKRSETPVSFDVYDGEQLVHRAVFAQTQVTIGKGAKVDLCLEDATLSRIHAVVEIDGPVGGQVIDLASALGTYLNQQKVVRARLRSGDEVTVGRFRIVVAFGEDVGEVGDVLATAPARDAPRSGTGRLAAARSARSAARPRTRAGHGPLHRAAGHRAGGALPSHGRAACRAHPRARAGLAWVAHGDRAGPHLVHGARRRERGGRGSQRRWPARGRDAAPDAAPPLR
ncbi:MAG: FHA domain-containing protein [Sandaracinaceae bacterium]|nr:FHA domain-containing protein [Sandaracinaceae bacterium]